MDKQKAIDLLGGSIPKAAAAIGVSYQAVNQWPEKLTSKIADRVLAAVARERLPELLQETSPKSDPAGLAQQGV